jgi:hypothetical protein
MKVSCRLTAAAIAVFVAVPALSQESATDRRPLGVESRPGVRSATAPHALASGAVSHLLLPTSANVVGAFEAYFQTKVSIFNAVDATYQIRIGLSVTNGEIAHKFLTIEPGETVTFRNILKEVFGFTGGGAIDLDSGNSGHKFIVSSQVYVETINGRYTTAVQFADDLGAIVPSRPGYIVGMTVDFNTRTNLGCASNSPRDQTITFQPFDSDGFVLGPPFEFVLKGWGWGQYSVNGSLSNGGLQIKASDNAVCYAVEVNNKSNDGTYQLATPF